MRDPLRETTQPEPFSGQQIVSFPQRRLVAAVLGRLNGTLGTLLRSGMLALVAVGMAEPEGPRACQRRILEPLQARLLL